MHGKFTSVYRLSAFSRTKQKVENPMNGSSHCQPTCICRIENVLCKGLLLAQTCGKVFPPPSRYVASHLIFPQHRRRMLLLCQPPILFPPYYPAQKLHYFRLMYGMFFFPLMLNTTALSAFLLMCCLFSHQFPLLETVEILT